MLAPLSDLLATAGDEVQRRVMNVESRVLSHRNFSAGSGEFPCCVAVMRSFLTRAKTDKRRFPGTLNPNPLPTLPDTGLPRVNCGLWGMAPLIESWPAHARTARADWPDQRKSARLNQCPGVLRHCRFIAFVEQNHSQTGQISQIAQITALDGTSEQPPNDTLRRQDGQVRPVLGRNRSADRNRPGERLRAGPVSSKTVFFTGPVLSSYSKHPWLEFLADKKN